MIVDETTEGVRVRVLDQGAGIDPEEVARLFELYYRSPIDRRTVGGAGIGLFVCRVLVEAMGGRIWAAPRPEGGAEFGFVLARFAEDSGQPENGGQGTAGRVGSGSGKVQLSSSVCARRTVARPRAASAARAAPLPARRRARRVPGVRHAISSGAIWVPRHAHSTVRSLASTAKQMPWSTP